MDRRQQPQPASAFASATAPMAQPLTLLAGERPIGRYDFEGGAYVRIAASGEIDTETALDMVQTLIDLKRRELARRNKVPNVGNASADVAGADDGLGGARCQNTNSPL